MSKELTQDWNSYQRIFHPKKRQKLPEPPAVFTAVVQGEKTIRLLPTSDQLPYQGRTAEIRAQLPQNSKLKEVTVRDLEDAIENALSGDGIFDQIESIRDSLKKVGTTLPATSPHFLIRALTDSWWAKLLPSSYGLLIGLERTKARPQYFLLIVKKGRVSAFFSPDLSGLSEERATDTGEVVKYLSQKFALKVQGMVAHHDDWMEWAGGASSPWKKVAGALRQDRLQFVPFRFRLVTLVGARGHLGL